MIILTNRNCWMRFWQVLSTFEPDIDPEAFHKKFMFVPWITALCCNLTQRWWPACGVSQCQMEQLGGLKTATQPKQNGDSTSAIEAPGLDFSNFCTWFCPGGRALETSACFDFNLFLTKSVQENWWRINQNHRIIPFDMNLHELSWSLLNLLSFRISHRFCQSGHAILTPMGGLSESQMLRGSQHRWKRWKVGSLVKLVTSGPHSWRRAACREPSSWCMWEGFRFLSQCNMNER